MRLQTDEIKTIIQTAREIYGESVKVYLFGSRTDDSKRGGDHEQSPVAQAALKEGILLI